MVPIHPVRQITIIQGDPGEGKTTIVLRLAAMLSKGEILPEAEEKSEPINIIYQTAEDGLSDTIKPRLEAAEADCNRILVIDESDKPLPYAVWKAEQNGEPTWKTPIRQDIDHAIAKSNTFATFTRALKDMGYTMRYGENVKYMTVSPPWYDRSIRIHRLGDAYTEEAIKARLYEKRHHRVQQMPRTRAKRVRVVSTKEFLRTRLTWEGIRGLYYYYLIRMKKAQQQPQKVSYGLRQDLRCFKLLCKHGTFMAKHNLDTPKDFACFSHTNDKEHERLASERQTLRNEMRRVDNADRQDEFKQQIAEITLQMKPLHERKKTCASILQCLIIIRENIQRLLNEDKDRKAELANRKYKARARGMER